jgi:hypothetical protein
MASQYIQQNNQNLLWKIINNTPQMIQFFNDSSPGEKEKWFQNVIRHVYNSHSSNSNISLRDLNKTTIDFMLEMLQKAQQQNQPQQQQNQPQQPQQQTHQKPIQNQLKPKQIQNSAIENQFELRRQEYENMTKKTVPVPAFTENIKDEAISDIGSAVNEYMKQRDQDMKLFSAEKPNNKIKINKDENISITVEEIESPPSVASKKVKWGENVEHDYIENVPFPIENVGEKILDALNKLSEKMDKIIAQNELLRNSVKE